MSRWDLAYYNTVHPPQALGNSPQPRAGDPPSRGQIIAIPQVGGFHHRYQKEGTQLRSDVEELVDEVLGGKPCEEPSHATG